MTETASPQAVDATPRTAMYDAFMSYSHRGDDLLAPRLQSALQRFAKPWWKRRALRVFRDQSSLSANPHLWASITEALDSSAWFILLASPEAAASEWVNREVEWWLEHGDPDRILPVVTDGEFAWDNGAGDLDRAATNAAPPALFGAFRNEPRWVDLRFARTDEQLDLRNAGFRDAVADLASAIRGVPKDDLESEEVRRHRGAMRTAWIGSISLAVLLLAAVASAVYAGIQRAAAEEQASIALGRGLGAQATLLAESQLDTSLLLGVEAVHASDDPGAYAGLLAALDGAQHLTDIRYGLTGELFEAEFSADARLIAIPDQNGAVTVWDIENDSLFAGPLVGPDSEELPEIPYDIQFSGDSRRLAAAFGSGTWVWMIPEGTVLATMTGFFQRAGAMSPDGRYLIGWPEGTPTAKVWDIDGSESLPALDLGFGAESYGRWTFSPDGSRMAFEGESLVVRAFPGGELLFDEAVAADTVAWSSQGDLLAIANPLGIRIFDAKTMSVLIDGLLPEVRPGDGIAALAFNPSGSHLAAKNFSGAVTVLEITEVAGEHFASETAVLSVDHAGGGPVGWQDDDRLVASTGVVAKWDLSQVTTMGRSSLVPGDVWDFDVAPDGSIVVATSAGIHQLSEDGSTQLTDMSCEQIEVSMNGGLVGSRCESRSDSSIVGLDLAAGEGWHLGVSDTLAGTALSADGEVFVALDENVIEVRAVSSGELLSTTSFGSFDWRISWFGAAPIWLEEEDRVVAITGSGDLRLIDIQSGLSEAVPVADQWISDVALHPDGRRLFVSADNGIKVVNLDDRSVQAFAADGGRLAISPDGAMLVTVSGGLLQLWDIDRAARIGPPLHGSRRGISSMLWTDFGLVSAGSERPGDDAFARTSVFETPAGADTLGPEFGLGTSTMIEWDLDVENLVPTACRLAGRSLTESEWAEYLPGLDYDPFC